MIRTLAWKDYREQRGLWLAIACLAGILCFGITLLSGDGATGWRNDVLSVFLLALIVAQGMVCGAQLLAGEKEASTLDFLDGMSGVRYPLWRTKLVVGLLFTLAQTLVFIGLTLAFQIKFWDNDFPLLVMAGVLALFFGLAGGAIAKKVFPAILIAVFAWIGTHVPLGGLADHFLSVGREVTAIVLALIALAVSKKQFCATDLGRVRDDERPITGSLQVPPAWLSLLWLSEKQGRWIIWPGMCLSVFVGFLLTKTESFEIVRDIYGLDRAMYVGVDYWPIVITLAIGLVCGIAAFGPEQAAEQERFLGAQRFSPGTVWLVKSAFWAITGEIMMMLFYLTLFLLSNRISVTNSWPTIEGVFLPGGNLGWLLVVWPLLGFGFGQFFVFLSRKTVVAGFLAVATSLITIIFWVPSLIFGGVQSWQIMAIPLILLGAARLSMWFWFSGSLYARRHLLILGGSVLVVALWMCGNFWYRAAEIPNVGEPFDLGAFYATLDRAARSPAGPLLEQGEQRLVAQKSNVAQTSEKLTKRLFPITSGFENEFNYLERSDYVLACWVVAFENKGWPPEDSELGPWLDAIFAGDWVEPIRAAQNMPRCRLIDPRGITSFDSARLPWPPLAKKWQDLGALLAARTYQLLARTDDAAALENLETCLGLSRHIHNCAPTAFDGANTVEGFALRGFTGWLKRIGPDATLLRKALKILQDHERAMPDPLDNIKADYLVARKFPTNLWSSVNATPAHSLKSNNAKAIALECPWEKARQQRFLQALYQGRLRLAGLSPHEWKKIRGVKRNHGKRDVDDFLALENGLELTDAGWSAMRWGGIIRDYGHVNWPGSVPWLLSYGHVNWPKGWVHDFPPSLYKFRALQLYVALLLYQIEEHRMAPKLNDLVPRYFSALPLVPWINQSFDYRILIGPTPIAGRFPMSDDVSSEIQQKELKAHQALLSVDMNVLSLAWGSLDIAPECYVIPDWTKK